MYTMLGGSPIKKEGSLAETLGTVQPFRYRGYVYDEETGVYYLSTRYYSSSIIRFINADSVVTNRLLGSNFFMYCDNSPICRIDTMGLDGQAVFNAITNVIDFFLPGNSERASIIMSGKASLYDYVNWLTLGFADTVKEAVMPEKTFSLEHWIDSAEVVGTGFFFYKFGQFRRGYKSGRIIISPAAPQIKFSTDPNRINHIMDVAHAWNRVNATTWNDVQKVIEYTVLNGTSEPYLTSGSNFLYSCTYGNEIIQVNVRIVDEVLNIVDAWVKTR